MTAELWLTWIIVDDMNIKLACVIGESRSELIDWCNILIDVMFS